MLEPRPDAIYAKTAQGSDEVSTRRHGLGMRVRQLLILIDGRRRVADLARLVPEKDLAVHLALLESQGFVVRTGDAPGPPGGVAHVAHVAPAVAGRGFGAPLGLVAGARLEPAAQAARPAPGPATGPAPGPASGPAAAAASAAAAATPPAERRDLETLRRIVVRHLVEAIGPHGDGMAVRVERCRSVDELREMLPSIAGLVEAIRGRAAMAAFLQRVGPL